MANEYIVVGRHLIAELSECDCQLLNNIKYIERAMNAAAIESGATVLSSNFHMFSPQGVSGVVVIAESHMSIHTWPEYGYAAIDAFTCGERANPTIAIDLMKVALQSKQCDVKELKRGIF